jgi:thiosulfate dehydrogenase [quinone] large subunit
MATMSQHPVPAAEDVVLEPEVVRSSAARKALAALRIAYGLTFLWAFLDKTFALGFHTGAIVDEKTGEKIGTDFMAQGQAWLNGGSPTEGFLKYGVSPDNPLHGFYNAIAGDAWTNWLFMLGLLGIGLALTFGFGMRIAAVSGAILYGMMYLAALPWIAADANNPLVDDHVIGFVVVIVLALTLAGDTWGVGKAWAKTHLVRQYSWLR